MVSRYPVTVLSATLLLIVLLSGCGGWEMPGPRRTDVDPRPGSYSFSQRGCFRVEQDAVTGAKYVVFASDCYRYDRIPVVDGGFSHQWGEINGTHCPTDGYAIAGWFVTPTRAEGVIRYAYACRAGPRGRFIARLQSQAAKSE